MATGQKAFQADSKASLIAKILTFQPPLIKTLQPMSPPELDEVVQRCLAKKPEERWQSASEVTTELQEIAEAVLPPLKAQRRVEPVTPAVVQERSKVLSQLMYSRTWKLSLLGILFAVVVGSLIFWRVRKQPAKPMEKQKEISSKPLTSYSWDHPLISAAISPDGKYLAFCSNGKLFIQVIRTGEQRPLDLPEDFYLMGPSWFPDGTKLLLTRFEARWIQVNGHATREFDKSLWSMSILGGLPRKILDQAGAPDTVASVSPDGSLIAFDRWAHERQTTEVWLVGSNGESPRRLRQAASERVGYFSLIWSSNEQRLFYFRQDHNGLAIESCDLRGEKITTTFSSKEYALRWNLCWALDGRLLFPMTEKGSRAGIFNLWEIKVDPATGKPLSEARRLTDWPEFSFTTTFCLSITADGKQLALIKANAQADVYVAELEPGGQAIKRPRRLTLAEIDDFEPEWTANSRAVFFVSYRNGNADIFKQRITQTDAETIVASSESESHPHLSPDGNFILYLVSGKPTSEATRLMRIPVGGGPPELVLRGEKIQNFSCAREENLCVVAEEVGDKQVLTTFDPLKGRGEKLTLTDHAEFGTNFLSPQGRFVERMKTSPAGHRIRIRSLRGGPVQEILFKNLIHEYQFQSWSFDGKGIYLAEWDSPPYRDWRIVYAGLDGRSQLVWKRGVSPGFTINVLPSPDDRHLAFTAFNYQANAWLLENF